MAARSTHHETFTIERRYPVAPARVFHALADTMKLGATTISVSPSTVELRRDGAGTRLVFTEQGVYLDGYDGGGDRVRGTEMLLTSLAGARQP